MQQVKVKRIDIKRGDHITSSENYNWTEDGYDLVALIREDDTPGLDDFDEGCHYDLSDPNLKRRAMNRAIKRAYDHNEWCYYGVTVAIRRCGVLLAEESLWGIEGNFTYKHKDTPVDNTHFIEMIDEVAGEAKHAAREKLFELQASLLNVDPPAKLLLVNVS